MKKKDILELKKRFKKDDCTFTRMCGCYVDAEKNIILNIKETFLTLDEDEFFKYLEIAKKVLSGTIGNNLLELEFPFEEDMTMSKQHYLMQLKKSALKDEALLENFYKSIIDSYDYTGNFLILIFHDAYDVIRKTTDNLKIDESEEVYEYLLCAICPVSLAKPGLAYFEEDNEIRSRLRDWVVEPPVQGFLFPAFTDRSSDVNSVMYYTKNAKDTHPELMEEVLGCPSKQTAAEQKECFTNIIRNVIGTDDEKSDYLFMEIQDNLNTMIDEHNSFNDNNEDEPAVLTNTAISNLLIESGVSEEVTAQIERCYNEEFGDTPPIAEHLIDSKALAANEQRKKEKRLQKQVEVLQYKLEKVQNDNAEENADNTDETLENIEEGTIENSQVLSQEPSPSEEAAISTDEVSEETVEELKSEEDMENGEDDNYDIVLKVNPNKVPQIKSQIIDGRKYLVIPMDDDDQANVNGVDTIV